MIRPPIIAKPKVNKRKTVIAYWAIKEMYNKSSTYFIHNKESLAYHIEKNIKDTATLKGKQNTLVVYEIFDLHNFSHSLRKKLLNQKIINRSYTISQTEEDSFNSNPLYDSKFKGDIK